MVAACGFQVGRKQTRFLEDFKHRNLPSLDLNRKYTSPTASMGGDFSSHQDTVAREAVERALDENGIEPINHLSTKMPAHNDMMKQASDPAYVAELFSNYPSLAELALVSGDAYRVVDDRGGDLKCLACCLDLSR